jgi:hypothetical protein
MDFAEDRRAQGMRGELSAVLDGDVRRHAYRVACTGKFGKMSQDAPKLGTTGAEFA